MRLISLGGCRERAEDQDGEGDQSQQSDGSA